MKKTILAVLLTIVLSLFLPTAIMAGAKDNEITISSCTLTTSSIDITGTTGAKAVMVRVKDESNNIIILQSFAVQNEDDKEEGTFTVSIKETFAEGTYNVSVADYEGGPWKTQSVTVNSSTSGESTSGESTSGESTSGESTSGESTSGESTSGESTSGESTSGESTSGESTSGGSTSGGATSGNNNQGGSYTGGGSGSTSSNAGEPTIIPSSQPVPTAVADTKTGTAVAEIVKGKNEDLYTAKIKAGDIDKKPVEIAVTLDPNDKEDEALMKTLLKDNGLEAASGESVKLILSISTSELSIAQKQEVEECITAIKEIFEGKTSGNDKLANIGELADILLKAGVTADDLSGKVSVKPELVLAKTYDFSLKIQIGDNKPTEIHDIGSMNMAVTFNIDKKLQNIAPDIIREFFMLHLMDNGKTEMLPVSVNSTGEGIVKMNSYSPFVLAYVDLPRYTVAGDKLTSTKYNATYRIIEGGNVNGKIGTLEYLAPIKKKSSHTVVSKVTIDGITYKVKSISANAFKGNEKVRKIKIGKYVTAIGSKAFYGCSSLKNVTIGKGISTIGAKAFYKATALENVIINSKKLKSANIGKCVWTKAGKSGKGITFTVPSSKLKSYKKLFGKTGAVQAD